MTRMTIRRASVSRREADRRPELLERAGPMFDRPAYVAQAHADFLRKLLAEAPAHRRPELRAKLADAEVRVAGNAPTPKRSPAPTVKRAPSTPATFDLTRPLPDRPGVVRVCGLAVPWYDPKRMGSQYSRASGIERFRRGCFSVAKAAAPVTLVWSHEGRPLASTADRTMRLFETDKLIFNTAILYSLGRQRFTSTAMRFGTT